MATGVEIATTSGVDVAMTGGVVLSTAGLEVAVAAVLVALVVEAVPENSFAPPPPPPLEPLAPVAEGLLKFCRSESQLLPEAATAALELILPTIRDLARPRPSPRRTLAPVFNLAGERNLRNGRRGSGWKCALSDANGIQRLLMNSLSQLVSYRFFDEQSRPAIRETV